MKQDKFNAESPFPEKLQQIIAREMSANKSITPPLKPFKKRPIESVFWWHMFDMLFIGGPFSLIICAGVFGYLPDEQFGLWYCIAAVTAMVMLVRQIRRFSSLACPQCQRKLTSNNEIEGPILFRCHDCRIDWDTGFLHGTD